MKIWYRKYAVGTSEIVRQNAGVDSQGHLGSQSAPGCFDGSGVERNGNLEGVVTNGLVGAWRAKLTASGMRLIRFSYALP